MSPREIVDSHPELQQVRRRARLLLTVAPIVAVAAVTAFLVHEPAVGWTILAFVAALLFQAVRLLLSLGGRIDAIKKGKSAASANARPQAPFFSGVLGKVSILCLIVATAAAALSTAQFLGAFHSMDSAWLGPFFFVLWAVAGLALGVLGQAMATAQLRERVLRASGIRGSARIVKFSEAGGKVKDASRVRCDLEITVPGRKRYSATVTSVVPIAKAPLLTAEKPVPVFVDPDDPHHVLIDW